MTSTTGWRYLACLVLALVAAPACGVSDLAFVQDDRLDIVRPGDRDSVALPVTIAWTADDVAVGAGEGSFAVFVDRPPPPPGRSLAWLFRDDAACAGRDGCPDDAYFADHGVYRTTGTSVTIEHLPQNAADGRRELHEATVALLDEDGRRVGESAWSIEFDVTRGG